MAFWLTDFRATGWPDNTSISLRATEGNGGTMFRGSIELAMRKGGDRSSDVPIDIGGSDLEADFANGVCEIKNLDLKAFADEQYDTLIINSGGRGIPRTFRNATSKVGTQTDLKQSGSKQPNFKMKLTVGKPKLITAVNGTQNYEVPVAIAGAPFDHPLDFYRDGVIQTEDVKTDGNGRASYVFREIPEDCGQTTLEVQARGKQFQDSVTITFTKPEDTSVHSIEVKFSYRSNASGYYPLTVSTYKDGKAAKLAFTIESLVNLHDAKSNQSVSGTQNENSTSGSTEFLLSYPENQNVTLIIRLAKKKEIFKKATLVKI